MDQNICPSCDHVMEPKKYFPVILKCEHLVCLECTSAFCEYQDTMVCPTCDQEQIVDLKLEKLNFKIMNDMFEIEFNIRKLQWKQIS